MRALAADTTRAISLPLSDLAPSWTVSARSGDTTSAERQKQDRRWPTALVTTPESLSLMLTRESARDELRGVHAVIVDEWHELMGNKRGVQVQLALARLRRWNPKLIVWGLSATLGNLGEAMRVLLGNAPGSLVQGRMDKTLVIDTLIPHDPGRFSWGGHLGKQMQIPVVEEIERSSTTLVFVNVRSQAEIWYQLLIQERPQWAGTVALHHGSLDSGILLPPQVVTRPLPFSAFFTYAVMSCVRTYSSTRPANKKQSPFLSRAMKPSSTVPMRPPDRYFTCIAESDTMVPTCSL